jgi:hydroxypyruvate reductase
MRPLPDAFFKNRETEALRRAAMRCLERALRAADPAAAVRRVVLLEADALTVADQKYDLRQVRTISAVGAGKAAATMASALEGILGDRLTAGIVSVKYGHGVATSRVEVREAGHPLPDAASVAAADAVLALADRAGEEDLVCVLLSGGGSALLVAPSEGATLDDKLAVSRLLLSAGAPIGELNAVRKHLSRIKGGHLARRIAPARIVTLALSDVLGNPLDVIASGPTAPDRSTYTEALDALGRRGVMDAAEKAAPHAVARLRDGAAGRHPETPKPGDPVFERTQAVIIGDLAQAVRAAQTASEDQGYATVVLGDAVEGEAREVGAALGRRARDALDGRYGPLPVCLLQGGETTVTVRGSGKGGRNQEVALGAALEVVGLPGTLVLAVGTDGTDGPTDAAGAVADGWTLERARRLGLDPLEHLDRNDAYPFFAALGDLIMTGPTLTNVNDLMMAFVDRPVPGLIHLSIPSAEAKT